MHHAKQERQPRYHDKGKNGSHRRGVTGKPAEAVAQVMEGQEAYAEERATPRRVLEYTAIVGRNRGNSMHAMSTMLPFHPCMHPWLLTL